MSGLSTHVLDMSSGKPAANMRVRLYLGEREINATLTNSDGRCAALLAQNTELVVGTYRLVFETGSWFTECFYPEVSITFTVNDPAAHYHVPLLISPFGYTTYRGS